MSIVIGITGGISSGKSNVTTTIKSYGYPIIDADLITKDLQNIGKPLYNIIVEVFGNDYLLPNKEINRKKLAKLIFSNDEAKKKLNNISHPIIVEEIKRQLSSYNGLVFLDVPLLYEIGLDKICDKVICVYLPYELQIVRLIIRDKIDKEFAIQKINSQMSLDKKKELADYVIDSSGSFEETAKEINKILNVIKGEYENGYY